MIRRIEPDRVRLGMYVLRLGGSFLSHPFWRTRFKLTSQTDVDRLRSCGIPYIEIDDELGCGPAEDEPAPSQSEALLVDRIGENIANRKARPQSRRSISVPPANRA